MTSIVAEQLIHTRLTQSAPDKSAGFIVYNTGILKTISAIPVYIHCLKKTSPLYILNDLMKNEPISITFDVRNPEEISHQNIVNSPNSVALSCEMHLI